MGEREWARDREDDEVRVGRLLNPTGQQKETIARIVLAGSGMQVDGKTSRMGKSLVVQGRSIV